MDKLLESTAHVFTLNLWPFWGFPVTITFFRGGESLILRNISFKTLSVPYKRLFFYFVFLRDVMLESTTITDVCDQSHISHCSFKKHPQKLSKQIQHVHSDVQNSSLPMHMLADQRSKWPINLFPLFRIFYHLKKAFRKSFLIAVLTPSIARNGGR